MAPGGFTATAKARLPGSLIHAFTLPPEVGGYDVMARGACQNIIYGDITMYPKEMGYEEEIPTGHTDFKNFEISRPFPGNLYDLIICGGAVARDQPRDVYRNDCESRRLTVSQLVFAMNRLKLGGSLILLLQRIESWDTVCILHAFNEFSTIQLYKHPKAHAIKSSFYLVAKNVNLDHDAAKESIAYWKALWKYLTFKESRPIALPESKLYRSDDASVRILREKFGPKFLNIAQPIWEIQAEALRKAPFI
ncbi:hypothetical protein N7539_008522 [Penicillium diatomitis]|uniref:Ribosomal RNA methyltransferase FtsJ domain-containing protein n=1 Tax=Penicillium diatomitis TaxID=2819901 RepID=A0A9X0BM07_9EURO|nr:uncharacterized protein N7539_008522 [Penicillium diatomitis]KAJ5471953.1 hypothetical protein N7539_008522 [Penicillium diatomitis]